MFRGMYFSQKKMSTYYCVPGYSCSRMPRITWDNLRCPTSMYPLCPRMPKITRYIMECLYFIPVPCLRISRAAWDIFLPQFQESTCNQHMGGGHLNYFSIHRGICWSWIIAARIWGSASTITMHCSRGNSTNPDEIMDGDFVLSVPLQNGDGLHCIFKLHWW